MRALSGQIPGLGLVRRERVGHRLRDLGGRSRVGGGLFDQVPDRVDLLIVSPLAAFIERALHVIDRGQRLPKMAVALAPGSTSETGIDHWRSSMRSASLIASMPNLDAL
jgi:hypothetical protein